MTAVLVDKGQPGRILLAAATHIRLYGHHTGDFAPEEREGDPGAPTCAAGAINVVTFGAPAMVEADIEAQRAGLLANLTAKDLLIQALGLERVVYVGNGEAEPWVSFPEDQVCEAFDYDDAISEWNDKATADEVIAQLEAAGTAA